MFYQLVVEDLGDWGDGRETIRFDSKDEAIREARDHSRGQPKWVYVAVEECRYRGHALECKVIEVFNGAQAFEEDRARRWREVEACGVSSPRGTYLNRERDLCSVPLHLIDEPSPAYDDSDY